SPRDGPVFSRDAHARAEHVASATDESEADPMVAIADMVDEQTHRSVVDADEDVDVAVVVDVAKGCAASHPFDRERRAAPARDVLKTATDVPEQLHALVEREGSLRSFRVEGHQPVDRQQV